MLKQINTAYRKLSPLKQLLISFPINFILWFFSSYLQDIVFNDEKHSFASHLFDGIFMAIFFVVLFNFYTVRQLFIHRKKHKAS